MRSVFHWALAGGFLIFLIQNIMDKEDQLRHSIDCLVSNEELMHRVKASIVEFKEMKKKKAVKPVIKWEDMLETKLFNNPNVTAIYDTTGEFDVLVIARFKNRKALDNYLKIIQGYEFVERTETKLILNTIKEENIEIF